MKGVKFLKPGLGIASLALLLWGAACSSSPQKSGMKNYSIEGVVLNHHNQPIPDAVITIASGTGSAPDIAAVSNDEGAFSFYNVEAGRYRLKVVNGQYIEYVEVTVDRDTAFVKINIDSE